MADDRRGEVTALLEAIRSGDSQAEDRLVGLVYAEFHGMAAGLMAQERRDHTLQPTALLHEALVQLFDADVLRKAPNRAYLFGAAARAMRVSARRSSTRPRISLRGTIPKSRLSTDALVLSPSTYMQPGRTVTCVRREPALSPMRNARRSRGTS